MNSEVKPQKAAHDSQNRNTRIDGKTRIEAYLKRRGGWAGITLEDFWLVDEIQLAVAAVTTQEDHLAWPFTTEALAVCVNQGREKTGKKPLTESDVRSVMAKLFGTSREPGFTWVGHIGVKQVMCKELDHDGNEVVIPRYQLATCGTREGFLDELDAVKHGKMPCEQAWEDFSGLKGFAPLDEVKRSVAKTKFIEDPEFSAMDTPARIKAYWADCGEHYTRKRLAEDGVTREEYGLLRDLLDCGYGPAKALFAGPADLAACVNAKRAKNSSPMTWGADGVMVTPLEISTLLERLHRRKNGRNYYVVDGVGVERRLVHQTDANGQPVLVPHYGFSDMEDWDYIDGEILAEEMDKRLIEMGVIVRTDQGQWADKHTEEVLLAL